MRCKCRRKHKCPLDGKCDETAGTCSLDGKYRTQNIVYKCTVSADEYPSKVYLGTAEGDFKQNLYNHRTTSFYCQIINLTIKIDTLDLKKFPIGNM